MTNPSPVVRIALIALAGLTLCVPGFAQDEIVTRFHPVPAVVPALPTLMVDRRYEAAFHPIGLYRSGTEDILESDLLQSERGGSVVGEIAELLESMFPLPTDGPDHVIMDIGEKIRVTGTPDLQRRVAAAIDAIAALEDRQVEMSIQQLTVLTGVLDDASRKLLIRAAAGRLGDEDVARLEELDVHGGARSGTLDAPAGVWTRFERTSFREHLADFDVEIAQDASIADPRVHRASEGARAAVRAFPMEDGRVLLRVVASCGDLVEPMRKLNPNASGLGTLELPDLSGSLQSTDLLVRPGETVGMVTGTMLGKGKTRWDVLLLRVDRVFGNSRRETLQRLPLSALAGNDPLRLVGFGMEGESRSPGWVTTEDHARPVIEDGQLEEELNVVDAAELEDGKAIHYFTNSGGSYAVLMHGTPRHLDAVRKRLLELEASELRSALVTIRIDDSSGTVGLLASRVVIGRPAGFACHRQIAYVRDADVEVAEKAQISDPIIALGSTGLMGNVHVRPGPEGTFEVALDLRLDALIDGPREIVHSAEFVSQVEAISVGTRRYTGRMRLKGGRTRILDLGGTLFGAEPRGKLRLLITVDPQE